MRRLSLALAFSLFLTACTAVPQNEPSSPEQTAADFVQALTAGDSASSFDFIYTPQNLSEDELQSIRQALTLIAGRSAADLQAQGIKPVAFRAEPLSLSDDGNYAQVVVYIVAEQGGRQVSDLNGLVLGLIKDGTSWKIDFDSLLE